MPIGMVKKQNEVKIVNMKSKVINVSYRKNSNSFPEWMKYEIEILNEDGTTTKIPAYGKDLQDALSRVVHDSKVEKLEKQAKRIPDLVWVVLWFGYILGWTALTYQVSGYDEFDGIFFLLGIGLITSFTFRVKSWFRKRNTIKVIPPAIRNHYQNAVSSSGEFNVDRMSEK